MLSFRGLNIALITVSVFISALTTTVLSIETTATALDRTSNARDASLHSTFNATESNAQALRDHLISSISSRVSASVRHAAETTARVPALLKDSLEAASAAEKGSPAFLWTLLPLMTQLLSHHRSFGVGFVGVVTVDHRAVVVYEDEKTAGRGAAEYHHYKAMWTNATQVTGLATLVTAGVVTRTGELLGEAVVEEHPGCSEKGVETNGSVADAVCVHRGYNTTSLWRGPPADTVGEAQFLPETRSDGIWRFASAVAGYADVPGAAVAGQVFADVNAHAFSGLLRAASSVGRVFLVERGRVDVLVAASHGLQSVAPVDSDDPIIAGFAARLLTYSQGYSVGYEALSRKNEVVSLKFKGSGAAVEEFYVRTSIIEASGLELFCNVVVGRATLQGEFDAHISETKAGIEQSDRDVAEKVAFNRYLLMVSAVGVAALLVAFCSYLAVRSTAPLHVLTTQMDQVSRMKLQAVEDVDFSIITEVRQIQESFFRMVACLKEYREYMPASVLQDTDSETDKVDGIISPALKSLSASASDCVSPVLAYKNEPRTRRISNASCSTTVSLSTVAGVSQALALDLRLKDVSIAVVNIVGFLACRDSSMQGYHHRFVATVAQAVKQFRGIADGFSGDRVSVSWNTVKACPMHRQCAAQAACIIKEFHSDDVAGRTQITAAVASGVLRCGNMGCEGMKKYNFIGSLHTWVCALERLNKVHDTSVLIDQVVQGDIASTH
eukprot:gene20136-30949_t